MTYKITTNQKGSRNIEVDETHLITLKKYGLLEHLTDSNGIVDEEVLERLKLTIRSLINAENDGVGELMDLCIDVIYHDNMKAFGLQQLLTLYNEWNASEDNEKRTEEPQ